MGWWCGAIGPASRNTLLGAISALGGTVSDEGFINKAVAVVVDVVALFFLDQMSLSKAGLAPLINVPVEVVVHTIGALFDQERKSKTLWPSSNLFERTSPLSPLVVLKRRRDSGPHRPGPRSLPMNRHRRISRRLDRRAHGLVAARHCRFPQGIRWPCSPQGPSVFFAPDPLFMVDPGYPRWYRHASSPKHRESKLDLDSVGLKRHTR